MMTGPEIQAERERRGLTRPKLAAILGCSKQFIQHIEQDVRPATRMRARIEAYFRGEVVEEWDAARLRRERLAAGLTMQTLAAAIGVSLSGLNEAELGKASGKMIIPLAQEFITKRMEFPS